MKDLAAPDTRSTDPETDTVIRWLSCSMIRTEASALAIVGTPTAIIPAKTMLANIFFFISV